MKVSRRQCFILPAVDEVRCNGERVKSFQIQPFQVHLIGFRRQLLPQRAGPGLWRILDELCGGFAVLAGAFVAIASLPMAAVLFVALLTVHLPYGFSSIKLMAVT